MQQGAKSENIRVSDVITQEDIAAWEQGSIITLQAQTGSGKSFFIKNSLYEFARTRKQRILLLINRAATVEQFRMELERDGKDDTVTVWTYQRVEVANLQGWHLNLLTFDFIVADEAHYFLSDAIFNNKIDLSFNEILRQEHAIKIMMTATMHDFHAYLTACGYETVDYRLPVQYNHIEELVFFTRDNTIELIAQQIIDSGEKGILFIDDLKRAYELHKKFRSKSIFCCSKDQPLYKNVDEQEIRRILKEERFDAPLLISSSCLATGLNLIDSELKHILIDITDPDVVVQAAGRKRTQSANDKVRLYIRSVNNNALGGYEQQTRKSMTMATFLMEHSLVEFIQEFPRTQDKSGLIYEELVDGKLVKKVNPLMLQKKQNDIATYRKMQALGSYGFCKYLAQIFGFYDSETDTYHHKLLHEDYGILKFLENICGRELLNCKDRKELINRINVRSNGKLLRSLDTLNAALAERGIPYRIMQFRGKRKIDGVEKDFKAIWRVYRIDEEIGGAA